MHTDKSYAFHEGMNAYFLGLNYDENPYTVSSWDSPIQEWVDWYEGWDAAYHYESGLAGE